MSNNDASSTLDDAAIRAIYGRVSNWGRWGAEDQAGALNLITPARRVTAAGLIREGVSVSCAYPVDTIPSPTNILPAQHYVTAAGDIAPKHGPGFTYDYIGVSPHGISQTHLDALCHVCHDGRMYNDRPVELVTSAGSGANAVTTAVDGIASRGLLLDIAGARGVDFIEPEDPIRPGDFEKAEKLARVKAGEGDIVLYRTGRHERRAAKGRFSERLDGKSYLAGIYPDCLEWVHERGIALLGSDGAHDVLPAPFPQEQFPIHVGTQVYIGVQLIHNLRLDTLLAACTARDRFTFFLSVQPLNISGATASPVNPIAIF